MNVKILTKQELQYFREKYRFELNTDKVFVYVNGYNRVTAHNINERINITCKVRRIIISPDALFYWSKYLKDKYSPIEVQNAMNFLKISYKPILIESIDEALRAIAKL
jgi:hypothetical protein